jgi:hypothetical protein
VIAVEPEVVVVEPLALVAEEELAAGMVTLPAAVVGIAAVADVEGIH